MSMMKRQLEDRYHGPFLPTLCAFDQAYLETHGERRGGTCYGCLAKEANERDWESDADRHAMEGVF